MDASRHIGNAPPTVPNATSDAAPRRTSQVEQEGRGCRDTARANSVSWCRSTGCKDGAEHARTYYGAEHARTYYGAELVEESERPRES